MVVSSAACHIDIYSLKVTKPQRNKPPPFILPRQPNQQPSSNDTNRIRHRHRQASRIRKLRTQEPTYKQRAKLHETPRDLQVLAPQRVETKGGDDDAGEAGEGRIGNLRTSRHDEEDPSLGISQGLSNLVGFEMPILDALPIRRHALNGDLSFPLREEFRRRREIREQGEREKPAREAARAEDQEDVHPPW